MITYLSKLEFLKNKKFYPTLVGNWKKKERKKVNGVLIYSLLELILDENYFEYGS